MSKASFLIVLLIILTGPTLFGQGDGHIRYVLKGRVFFATGHPFLDRQLIALSKDEQLITSLETDSLGYFAFPNLLPGSYRLTAKEWGRDTLINLPQKEAGLVWFFLSGVCKVNQQVALQDINRNHPRLLLVGSIAPVIVSNQHLFEKKFRVKYYDFGCTPPDHACIMEYNQTVFNYLDKRFGKKWRKSVRKDVIGYKN